MEHYKVGQNIILEEINLKHATTIFSAIYDNRSFLRTWLPFVDHTQKVTDTETFIRSVIEKPEGKRDNVYTIEYNNKFAGLVGFKDTDRANLKTELGYWLCEKMQGKGIMTRSISKMIDIAFEEYKLNRVQVKVAVGNNKSVAIPKRLNFYFEGVERKGELHAEKFLDLEIYSLLKDEWRGYRF